MLLIETGNLRVAGEDIESYYACFFFLKPSTYGLLGLRLFLDLGFQIDNLRFSLW